MRFAADWEVDALAVRVAQIEKEVEAIKKRMASSFALDIPALSSRIDYSGALASRTDYSGALASRLPENITCDLPPMPRAKRVKNGKISTNNKPTK